MKVIYPDYTNSISNLMNSIRLFFNLPLTHSSLEDVDKILDKNKYHKVIVMLLDGMGSKIIEKHLKEDSFLVSHKLRDFISTFPSTTAAATTVARTGLNPNETGWLGWHQYFKEIDNDLICFTQKDYYDSQSKLEYPENTVKNIIPTKTLVDEFNEKGIKSVEIMPDVKDAKIIAKSFNDFLRKTKHYINECSYVYSYWYNPDALLHAKGTDSIQTHNLLKRFDKKIAKFSKELPDDAIMFIIADHGHLNYSTFNLYDYPDILLTLKRLPSIEPKNSTFYVKDDCKEKFIQLYNKYWKNDFELFTHKEVIDKNLFGIGKSCNKFEDFIGDFQVVSKSSKSIRYLPNNKKDRLKSSHAGISEDEMLIPLIVVNK